MVGKPIEGWSAVEIRSYLEAAGAWPLDDYFPCVDPMPDGSPPMKPSWPRATRGRISGTARDDDIDYTVLGLLLLEEHGLEFTEEQVADALLARLPFGQVYTAERAAYRNLVDGIQPPRSATHRNPYREWIGALIRADIYGYVSPGDPRGAASLAARDASVTHAGAGIHAAMWAAALLAECLVRDAPRAAVAASLDHVPPGSRLRRVLGDVVGWRAAGEPWEAVSGRLTDRFAGMSWVHALNNAALVAAALLWGDGDFGVSVGLAASAGWDADSAAATVGSAFGALHGARAIPDRFVHPLENRVESAVFGVGSSSIAGLADRTVHVARQAHLARSIAVPA
jgi:ADP-ribosylglycohydrolase